MRGNAAKRAEHLTLPRCLVTGKLSFPSRAQARRFFRQRRDMPGWLRKNEYVCSHCGAWHLTTARRPKDER